MTWKQMLVRTTALAVVTLFSISDTCYAQRGGEGGGGGGGGSSNRGGGGGGGSNRGDGGGGGGANFSARSSGGGGQSSNRGGGGSSMSRSRSSGPSSSRDSSQISGGSQFRSSDSNRSGSSIRSADSRGSDSRGSSLDGLSGDNRSGSQQSFFRGPTSDQEGSRRIGADGNRGASDRGGRDGERDRNSDLNNFLNGRDGDRDRSDGDRHRGDNDLNRGDIDRNRGDVDRNRGDNDLNRGNNDRDRLSGDRDRNRDWDRNRDGDRDRNDWSRQANRFRDDWGRRDRNSLPFRYGWWNSYGWNGWPVWSPWRYSRWQNRPYYWWGWTPANALTSWVVYGWDRPRYWAYGPGGNIWYQDDYVYYDGNRYLPANDYYQRVYDLAHSVPEYDQATAESMDWRPLGVFAVIADDRNDSSGQRTMQLAVNRDGVIAGTYFSENDNQVRPLSGMVDRTSQRAAWVFADGKDDRTVFETSLFNLTKPETTVMVHYGPNADETEVWHLARIERPEATAVSSTDLP